MKVIELKTEIPGPKSKAWLERRRKVVSAGISIGKSQLVMKTAAGATLTDIDGNTFLDFAGGIGCLNAGHTQTEVIEAMKTQMQNLQHSCFQVLMNEPYIELCEKLVAITPPLGANSSGQKKAALFNSGAEAVENAIKIARSFTKRNGVVCFENAFHGRTLLTMSLTSKVKPYKEGFGPFAPEVYQMAPPFSEKRLHEFFKATVIPEQIAAVIVEPVMGEGGFSPMPLDFMKALAKFCHDTGMVLIFDEIQSGFARTGKMFASEHFPGVLPDLLTLAKSMSSGMPISAVVGAANIMDAVPPGGLGGTFAGNPVAAAAALATIEIIEKKNLCARSQALGEVARARFEGLQKKYPERILEVRGFGAMLGVEFIKAGVPDKDAAEVIVGLAAKRGVILLTAGVNGNVIRTLMPLVMTDPELLEALAVIESCIHETLKG